MPDPSLHHIGYVVASIEESIGRFRASLSACSASSVYEDEIQQSRVAFLDLPPSGSVKLELVEPLTAESPVRRFVDQGGGLHHLCFEVDDIADQIKQMKAQKAMLIRRPQPATAFGGRSIAWMRTRDGLLVEYLARTLSSHQV